MPKHDPTSKESDEEAQSIVNEVRFLAASCQHPNIVQLLGTFCAKWRGKSLWLLALELCSGGRLQDHVKIYGHLEPITGEGASVGLLSAVAHLHGRRILHRDIRPQNILLAENLRSPSPQVPAISALKRGFRSCRSCLLPWLRGPVLVNFGNACRFEDASLSVARRTARTAARFKPVTPDASRLAGSLAVPRMGTPHRKSSTHARVLKVPQATSSAARRLSSGFFEAVARVLPRYGGYCPFHAHWHRALQRGAKPRAVAALRPVPWRRRRVQSRP